jgi:hypothetical protein
MPVYSLQLFKSPCQRLKNGIKAQQTAFIIFI